MPIVLPPGSGATGRTFLELQDEVLAHGFDPQVYRPQIKRSLNDALSRMLSHIEVAEHQTSTTIDTVAEAQTISLDFIPEPERTVAIFDTSTDPFVKLNVLSLVDLQQLGSQVGRPRIYALYGESLYLFPTPDGVYPLQVLYWSSATELVDDGDVPAIPIEYTDLLVSWAASRAYKREDDFEAAAFHKAEFIEGLKDMAADVQYRNAETRQVAGMLDMWAGYCG